MKKCILLIGLLILNFSCESTEGDFTETSDSDFSLSELDRASADPVNNNGNGNNTSAGQITAGEWSDLDNWQFWVNLSNSQEFSTDKNRWYFNTSKRIAINVTKANQTPYNNAEVSLFKENNLITVSKTDNHGIANFFVNLFNDDNSTVDISDYTVAINGERVSQDLLFYQDGINNFIVNAPENTEDRIELAFMVDATGSMSDELEFLKNDLTDVITKVKVKNANSSIYTATVFYRDRGDEYITRRSNFSASVQTTSQFITQQHASGGGDFEEAVGEALHETIFDLQWSNNAKTKIAFLLLDAPPHKNNQVVSSIKKSVKASAKKGIKLIPIVASGIDKNTEFLMRHLAIVTNGTYVFITDDSGIGNDHLEPTVGEYEVEFLNDLLVRLIDKYAK